MKCNSLKEGKLRRNKSQLTNTHLNKLKYVAKYKTETTLRTTKGNFQDEELLHELFLTIRKSSKIRNAFANNMSTNIRLSKAQLSKIIQSRGFFWFFD